MKLVKILSDSVQIRTNVSEFQNVRINDLLEVSDGSVRLVTMVTVLLTQIRRSVWGRLTSWERLQESKRLTVPLSVV